MRLLGYALLIATAQASSFQKSAGVERAIASPRAADQEIRAMETQWNDARAHADVATLDRILVDDWTVTHANGTTDTKAKYLSDLRTCARKFAGGVTEGVLVVHGYGRSAVVAGSGY